MTVEVLIDPNVRLEHGWTFTGFDDIEGGVAKVGDAVKVRVEETDLVGTARIVDADLQKRLVFLEVNWASIRSESAAGTSKKVVTPWEAPVRSVPLRAQAPVLSWPATSAVPLPWKANDRTGKVLTQ